MLDYPIAAELAKSDCRGGVRVLINLGINDIQNGTPEEVSFKAAYNAIIAAVAAKWSAPTIYLTKPWGTSVPGTNPYDSEIEDVAGWIDDLVAANPYCRAGIDERDSGLQDPDDGITYYVDGIHYSDAGKSLVAALWKTVLGY